LDRKRDASTFLEGPFCEYTRSEIGRHNCKRNCWIVIDGTIYDVTRWIDHHPGGDII
jgi:cytochrome b involved in lipid metabolism